MFFIETEANFFVLNVIFVTRTLQFVSVGNFQLLAETLSLLIIIVGVLGFPDA